MAEYQKKLVQWLKGVRWLPFRKPQSDYTFYGVARVKGEHEVFCDDCWNKVINGLLDDVASKKQGADE